MLQTGIKGNQKSKQNKTKNNPQKPNPPQKKKKN